MQRLCPAFVAGADLNAAKQPSPSGATPPIPPARAGNWPRRRSMRLGRGFVCPGSKNAPVGRFEAFRGMGQRPMSPFDAARAQLKGHHGQPQPPHCAALAALRSASTEPPPVARPERQRRRPAAAVQVKTASGSGGSFPSILARTWGGISAASLMASARVFFWASKSRVRCSRSSGVRLSHSARAWRLRS